MWMTIQKYADKQGISYQAARNSFKKYGAELIKGGHVREEGRTTMIDGYAADYLASKRKKGRGTSLARSVQYESFAKESVNRMSGKSGREIEKEIVDVREEIKKLRKEVDEDIDKAEKIITKIKKDKDRIEECWLKLDGLYMDLINKNKQINIEEIALFLKEKKISMANRVNQSVHKKEEEDE